MSVDFIVGDGKLEWDHFVKELVAGRVEGVKGMECETTDLTVNYVRIGITDDHDYIWAYCDLTTGDVTFTKYGANSPWENLIPAIEWHFDVKLVDEHDPRYPALLGFDEEKS